MENDRDLLKGTTLKVYWFMLKIGHPVRITDIQRGLHLSTPSLAQYHIKKLVESGYIREGQSGFVVERVETKNFFRLRNTLIPFHAAYIVFFSITFSAMLVTLATANPFVMTSFDFVAVVVNTVALVISVYETIRTLRSLP